MFDYRKWCRDQSAAIEAKMKATVGAVGDMAVYFIPTDGRKPGRLELAWSRPEGATDVVRFPGVGTRVASVPYSHLFGGIYDACQRLPLIPTEGG